MLLADVNVFVNAHRGDTTHHRLCDGWLASHLGGPETVGLNEMVLCSFVRIVTNPRIFVDPTPADVALDFCAAVLSAPGAQVVSPGPRHWRAFDALCRTLRLHGNAVPDAYLAALALEHGATLVTLDAAFRRFPGVRVAAPG